MRDDNVDWLSLAVNKLSILGTSKTSSLDIPYVGGLSNLFRARVGAFFDMPPDLATSPTNEDEQMANDQRSSPLFQRGREEMYGRL